MATSSHVCKGDGLYKKIRKPKTRIKVEYNIEGKKKNEIRQIDEMIMDKIKSIGGKWYAQGCDNKGNRDICFDLNIN